MIQKKSRIAPQLIISEDNFFFLISVIFVVLVGIGYLYTQLSFSLVQRRKTFLASTEAQQFNNLVKLRNALISFNQKNDHYPISNGLEAAESCPENITSGWMHALIPEFIQEVPKTLSKDLNCEHQALYISDGSGFKLILDHPDNFSAVISLFPGSFDPIRPYSAYGFWSSGWAKK